MMTHEEAKAVISERTSQITHQSSSISQWLTANSIKRGAALYWATLLTLSAALIHLVGILKQPPQSGILIALLLSSTLIQFVVAVAVVVASSRRLLLTAAIVEGVALLLWFLAHNIGLPDGITVWRPEALGMPDLYLPLIEGISAGLFLCLFARTWTALVGKNVWRTILNRLPLLFLLCLLIAGAIEFRFTELALVAFLLDAQFPTSLQYFFVPVLGLAIVFLAIRLFIPTLRRRTRGAWSFVLILLPALLVTNILVWDSGTSAANVAWFSKSSPVSAPMGQTTTLSYCNSASGSPLAIDISEPSSQASRPAPVVIYIHGGETLQGSRNLEDGSADAMYFTQLRSELLGRGFVVGSIDYSLSPFGKGSNEVKEAKCAIRFLRTYAHQLGIDSQRIGVYGPSQGGYISSMLGTAGQNAGFDVGQYLNQSSSVQAVVDMWGPTDLTNFSGSPSWVSIFTQGSTPGGLKAASPVTYVAHNDPPFLIIHGTDDWFIAPHHSQNMAKMLQAAGVPVTLVMVQHDGHGLAAQTAGQIEQPSPITLVHMVSDFFTKTLSA